MRRGRRKRGQTFVIDQITMKPRPPAAIFEPRLPENRPTARHYDRYLSVNIHSSLTAAGLPRDWNCAHAEYYLATLATGACHALGLRVTWEPLFAEADPNDNNPHHGAIWGVVELYRNDQEGYERVLSALSKAAEILPECLAR